MNTGEQRKSEDFCNRERPGFPSFIQIAAGSRGATGLFHEGKCAEGTARQAQGRILTNKKQVPPHQPHLGKRAKQAW